MIFRCKCEWVEKGHVNNAMTNLVRRMFIKWQRSHVTVCGKEVWSDISRRI